MGYLELKDLKDVVTSTDETVDAAKNSKAFSELIQYLDDTSLGLIMREANGDGRQAMKMLKQHYAGKGNVRLIALWTELTSLEKLPTESITDYILKAEKAATSLKNASQTVSDPLLIAMMMKGLPEQYKPFCVVTTQNEVTEMSKFKTNLHSFEETERVRGGAFGGEESTVMKARFYGGGNRNGGKQWNSNGGAGAGGGGNRNNRYNNNNSNNTNNSSTDNNRSNNNSGLICYKCRGAGHKAANCNKNKWCGVCNKSSHNESECRKKNSQAKMANENSQAGHSFQFMAGESTGNSYSFSDYFNPWTVLNTILILGMLLLGTLILGPAIATFGAEAKEISNCCFAKSKVGKGRSMLVDSGASSHIVTDDSRFCSIDIDFKPQNHFVELADGTKHNEFALKRGTIEVGLEDKSGKTVKMKLHHVLYIPTFPMDIFSVPAAIENEAEVVFRKQSSELTLKNGNKFDVKKRQNLFFIDNVFSVSSQEVVASAVSD